MLENIQKSVLYSDYHSKTQMENKEHKLQASIKVVGGDCIEVALELKKKGANPAVLNMANAKTPGGGYKRGSVAQEENIHRRTNLYQYLDDPDKFNPHRNWHYPIPEFGGVYCANVLVFRDSETQGYGFMPITETLAFLTVAAYHKPATKTQTDQATDQKIIRIDSSITDKIKRKMMCIFNMALDHGHDAIVLSAFGCGAYRNPPLHIAQLFKEVILEQHYDNKFKFIRFAILDDHNTGKQHNKEGNLKPFVDTFA